MHVQKKIKKIAVTGGAASGKSTVCSCLEKKGLPVISLDAISRDVVQPGMPAYKKIVASFGEEVLQNDGSLNRPVLRDMITRDPQRRKALESWVQPEILRMMQDKINQYEKQGRPAVVVEVPLLFELNLEKKFDVSVLVAVEKNIQIRRLTSRDCVSEDAAKALVDIQMALDEKKKRADIIIENNGSYEMLCSSTEKVFKIYFENSLLMSKALDR